MKKVAVTGELASGKSTVCRFFKERGSYVVSADVLVHQLLTPQSPIGKQVIALLGEGIIVNDTFDRGKIAEIVFHDENLLKKLENLIHPNVRTSIESIYNQVLQNPLPPALFVVEIPLLFESGQEDFFDEVVLVVADPAVRKNRFQGVNFFEREKRFLPTQEKRKKATYLISNDGGLNELYAQCETVYQQLTRASYGL